MRIYDDSVSNSRRFFLFSPCLRQDFLSRIYRAIKRSGAARSSKEASEATASLMSASARERDASIPRSEGKVTFPRAASLPVPLPKRARSPSTFRMSSAIWKARPICRP